VTRRIVVNRPREENSLQVGGYVQHREQELGMEMRETFVWQTYKWGVEAQVDWYEAFADVLGECRKAHVLSMGSMAVTSSVRG
jgi:hypothetical protein